MNEGLRSSFNLITDIFYVKINITTNTHEKEKKHTELIINYIEREREIENSRFINRQA